MRLVLLVVAMSVFGCVESQAVQCTGYVCPGDSVCDDVHRGCVKPSQLESCRGIAGGEPCTIEMDGDGICDQNVCVIEGCGDGYVRGGEQCDGENVPEGADCLDINFYVSKKPTCTADCTFDPASCEQRCGDGMLQDDFEVCEIEFPLTETCVDFGFGAGNLGCVNCGPVTTGCVPFGWESLNVAATINALHGTSATEVYAAISAPAPLIRFNGDTWSAVDTSSCDPSLSEGLDFVWTPAPGIVFAAKGSTVIRMMNGTCTPWQVGTGDVLSLWAYSATEAWVSVDLDGVYRFDGTTWTKKITLSTGAAKAHQIVGTSPTDLYTRSNDGVRHYDGNTFSAPFTPPAGFDGIVSTLWATSTDLYVGVQLPAHIYRYDGAGWSVLLDEHALLTEGGGASGTVAGVTTGGRTYAMLRKDNPSRIFVLVNEGDGWVNLDAPVAQPTIGPSTTMWAASTGEVFAGAAVTANVLLMRGSTRVDRPGPGGSFASTLAPRGPSDVFALFGDSSTVAYWDGAAWNAETLGPVLDIDVSPGGTAYSVGWTSGLWVKSPMDQSWSSEPSLVGDRVVPIADNDVWVMDGTSRTVKRRHDAATIEQVTAVPYVQGDYLADMWGTSASNMFLFGGQGADSTLPLILHYNGSAWLEMMVPAAIGPIYRGVGFGANDIYAIGTTGKVAHYNGSTWTEFVVPASVNDVWGSANDLFVGTSSGMLHFDGTAWAPVATGTPAGVTVLARSAGTLMFFDFLGRWHQLVRTAAW